MNLLQQYLGEAVMVLREVMNNQESSDSSKVNAAKAIIETGFKAVELVDLENRITELEEMAHKTRRNSYS
jgi:DNA-directed RNA polymerase delta subunit